MWLTYTSYRKEKNNIRPLSITLTYETIQASVHHNEHYDEMS